VGSGIYGRLVKDHFIKEKIDPIAELEIENGCGYCLVEPDGERSFLSLHGAEYHFSRSWMQRINFAEAAEVFICGLEVEEPTGDEIINFVYERPELELFFAPGPRVMFISGEKMEALLKRRDKNGKGPFLHLNEKEALSFSGETRVEKAAKALAALSNNSLVITLGERGSYCFSHTDGRYVKSSTIKTANTTGAGDAHFGAVIACLKKGMNLEQACRNANNIAAEIISL
jgi:sugar/nucleoside kinase (ribokinase family)